MQVRACGVELKAEFLLTVVSLLPATVLTAAAARVGGTVGYRY